MESFREHVKTDEEVLSEGAVTKSPLFLFGLLWRTYSKIKGSMNDSDRAKYQAQLIWINGQLTFSYIKALEEKLEGIERELKSIKGKI